MELITKLLRSHYRVHAKIPRKEDFSLADILYMVTKALNAKIVVELGTGTGVSCRGFISALKETDGILYSIDIALSKSYPKHYVCMDEPTRNVVRKTVEKLSKLGNPVVFISEDSIQAGKDWNKGDIDILYCDSEHTYEHVLNELETWSKHNPRIVLIDDTLNVGEKAGWINKPYKAAQDFARKNRKKFVNLNFLRGTGIII